MLSSAYSSVVRQATLCWKIVRATMGSPGYRVVANAGLSGSEVDDS